jgi:hypothetical protein
MVRLSEDPTNVGRLEVAGALEQGLLVSGLVKLQLMAANATPTSDRNPTIFTLIWILLSCG